MRTSSWIHSKFHISQSARRFTVAIAKFSWTGWKSNNLLNQPIYHYNQPIHKSPQAICSIILHGLHIPSFHLRGQRKSPWCFTVTAESRTFTIKQPRMTIFFLFKTGVNGTWFNLHFIDNQPLFLSQSYTTPVKTSVCTSMCRTIEFPPPEILYACKKLPHACPGSRRFRYPCGHAAWSILQPRSSRYEVSQYRIEHAQLWTFCEFDPIFIKERIYASQSQPHIVDMGFACHSSLPEWLILG